jgi:hypothetical protein
MGLDDPVVVLEAVGGLEPAALELVSRYVPEDLV